MKQFFNDIEGFQILLVGLFFSLSLVLSTKIVSNTLSRSGIEVTGSAVDVVKSDSAAWDLAVTTAAASKKLAFEKLTTDIKTVTDYLKEKGFVDSEIELQNTDAYPVFKKSPETGESLSAVDHFETSQIVRVTSSNIQLVKEASLDSEKLLNKGVDLRSNPPAYFYNKLGDLKIKLLNKASEDAKRRAQAMLKSTGNRVGKIKSVKTGVFQITPPTSTDVSDYGYYDTSTIDKKVTAVTQVTFSIK